MTKNNNVCRFIFFFVLLILFNFVMRKHIAQAWKEEFFASRLHTI